MVLSEPEGLLRIAIADLETAQASSDPAQAIGARRKTAHDYFHDYCQLSSRS